MTKQKKKKKVKTTNRRRRTLARCGLCGATEDLTKTECCDNWICDDEDQYVMFSYARNICYRNHSRYTLCGYHYNEGHEGDWQTCPQCKEDFAHEMEMYVYYGTNEYNFEVLKNPPKYDPTHCAKCRRIIHLGEDAYTMQEDKYFCDRCFEIQW